MKEQFVYEVLNKIFKNKKIVDALIKNGKTITIAKGHDAVKYGEILDEIPIVIQGSINIYVHQNNNEILAFTLKEESLCIASYEFAIQRKPSMFRAVSNVGNSLLFLIPSSTIQDILAEYPNCTMVLFSEYGKCQNNLIESFKNIAFNNLENRLKNYLESDENRNKTHQEIANDLSTAREVVTRLIKKIYAS